MFLLSGVETKGKWRQLWERAHEPGEKEASRLQEPEIFKYDLTTPPSNKLVGASWGLGLILTVI